ncbi:hypothetical protein [Capnocytophaga sp. G2]|uniref:hypothetical protein n=1 Tax=Capnocytophaga sp. G2 TaxID=3110695 RepID=UPI002B4A3DE2|nr:hypothetical protein [Capnocytophaga sp. G2]MEB3003882.1 hypothetical protein [Capnocytophaga sp. G2]
MYIIYIICLAPLVIFIGIFLYLTIVRKNAFEERLALYRPQHQLSQKREAYLKGVHKFRLWVTGIIIVMFTAPLFIYLIVMIQEVGIITALHSLFFNQMKWVIPFIYFVAFLVYWLLSYVFKRNEKALCMLVEQMSDSDFELLLKIKDSLPFISKYNPSFVLRNDQLYIFLFFAIREIDPTKITSINWSSGKNGIFVQLKTSKNMIFTLSRGEFPYFKEIIKEYNPTLITP